METCLVGGDVHLPYARKESLRQFFKLVKDRRPATIIVNGDLLDFGQLSRFVHTPSKHVLMDEIKLASAFFGEIRSLAKNAEIVFVFGNHSLRLDKQLLQSNPEMWGLLDLEGLLNLGKHGVTPVHSVEKDNYFRWKDVLVGHFSACRSDSGATAMSLIRATGMNIVQNHVHRLGLVFKTETDRTLWGAEAGCLCELRPNYGGPAVNWQPGAFWMENDGKRTDPSLVWFR